MKSVHKVPVNVYHHSFKMETFALNRHRNVIRIPNALLDMFVNLAVVPLDADMIITALKMMPVSIVCVRTRVCWQMPVDLMHFVHRSNIDQGVNVPRIIWEIRTLNVNLFRMIIVQLMLPVHLERYVNRTDVLLGVVMTCTVSLKKPAFTNSAKIRVQSMALVDQTPFVNQLIMIDNAHAYLTLLVMLKLTAKEFDHHLNAQLINSVHLVLFALMKLVYKDVDTQKIAPPNKLASRTNVSTPVLHLVLVVLEQHVLLPIILPSVTAHQVSVVIQTSSVVKSHQNVELMMNAAWKRFA